MFIQGRDRFIYIKGGSTNKIKMIQKFCRTEALLIRVDGQVGCEDQS